MVHSASLPPFLLQARPSLDISTHSYRVEQRLLQMPPAQALQLRLTDYDGERLRLCAPLSPNINDKGNAFGGSLASVMTLAAWALMSTKLEEAGCRADVYVQDSTLRYLAPLYDDLDAEAELSPDQDWAEIVAKFAQRGKVRTQLMVAIRDGRGTLCCTLEGRFVALVAKE